jgi:hypothetical protein
MATKDLVTVAKYGNLQEASLLKAVLEDHGIACYLAGAETSGMLWYIGTALGGVKLQVEEHDHEQAQKILSDLESQARSPHTEPWLCPECGNSVDAGFEICWQCGYSLEPPAIEPLSLPSARHERLEAKDGDEAGLLEEVPDLDEMATRAFRAAVLGIALPPLLLYALFVAIELANEELSDRAMKKYYATMCILLFMLAAWLAFLTLILGN